MSGEFLFEVSKSLIGTSLGSVLGLGSAILVWRIQQRRLELASGNLAVVTLGQYVAALAHIRRAIQEETQEIQDSVACAPPWTTVRAIHAAFKRDLTIDLKVLSFLADRPTLLEKLAHCERLYFDFVETIDEYSKVHRLIQDATSKFPPDELIPLAEVERAVPPNLVAQANTLLASILEHLDRDESTFRKVATELSIELKRRFGRTLLFRRKQKIAELRARDVESPAPRGANEQDGGRD